MFSTLDIALLCDSRSLDADGNAFTPNATRYGRDERGIRAILGDGTTAATMPTMDALQGRFTFDGGDYMVLPNALDVGDVLADMGSIQDEFWMFYMRNAIWTAATDQTLFHKAGVGGEVIRLRYDNADTLVMDIDDGGGGTENTATSVPAAALTDNREWIITFQRALNVQEIWLGNVLAASDTDASVDASSAGDAYIGTDPPIANLLGNNCGVGFIGYGRGRVTNVYLNAVRMFLKRNL